jgi:hypothetical protein
MTGRRGRSHRIGPAGRRAKRLLKLDYRVITMTTPGQRQSGPALTSHTNAGGAAISVWQAHEARVQRDVALREKARADEEAERARRAADIAQANVEQTDLSRPISPPAVRSPICMAAHPAGVAARAIVGSSSAAR